MALWHEYYLYPGRWQEAENCLRLLAKLCREGGDLSLFLCDAGRQYQLVEKLFILQTLRRLNTLGLSSPILESLRQEMQRQRRV
ncbi:MAG: hypothetical protein RMJ19_07450, partial [Gemmatales bacterium]|nr:hypothetical protein [Gemmatales bacterium]MDW8175491.1 hypothetical protein [Gemmatales bacterium]